MEKEEEEKVEDIIEKAREKLKLDRRKGVFEGGEKLSSKFLQEESDPEAFTKEFLIERVFNIFKLKKLPEKHFRGISGELLKVDYRIKNLKGQTFLVEAKPINTYLYEETKGGAVNRIRNLFRLAEVKKEYEFGIATDGLKWIFIDKNGTEFKKLNLEKNLEEIKEICIGKEEVSVEKKEEEITKKFYERYNDLLHGGKQVSKKDCFVNNIKFVEKLEDREQIAQLIMNRLIFIKFLQSKRIIKEDILDYLSKQKESNLNDKLKQLFFYVLNKEKRYDIDPKFEQIPYLNGGLFIWADVERANHDYSIRIGILKKVIEFLDSFKFIHKESLKSGEVINPEILGYIFEKSMTATDRKGTGSYYTPKTITNYISVNTIFPLLLDKINKFLKEKREYPDRDLLKNIEGIYELREPTLKEVYKQVVRKLKICDNACGSGAFLLKAANALFDIYKKIDNELRLGNSDIIIKKMILLNNLYGVDINPNAIEIAKLRLWLWLADSYDPEEIKPLPNIEYNLRCGNSLIGYIDISGFDLYETLKQREDRIEEYKYASGEKAQHLKEILSALDRRVAELDRSLFKKIRKKVKITKEEFFKLRPFHWGFEFYGIFDKNKLCQERGFDIIIGNPPYGNILKDIEKNFVEATYYFKTIKTDKKGKGSNNAASIFIERSYSLLKSGGVLGYIIPNSIARIEEFEKIRKFLLNEAEILQLIDEGPPFRDVTLEMIVIIYKKNKKEDYEIEIFSSREQPYKHVNKINKRIFERFNRFIFYHDKIFEKCNESASFVLGGFRGDDFVKSRVRKMSIKKPIWFLQGKNIQKYSTVHIKSYDLNIDKSCLKIYPSLLEKEIVITQFSSNLKGAIINKVDAAPSGGCVIVKYPNNLDINFVLALINSKLFNYYLYNYILNRSNLTVHLDGIYLKKLPVKTDSKEQIKKIVKLVDEMLKLKEEIRASESKEKESKEKQIKDIDKKINDEVYKIYQITPEEQETIEHDLQRR